MALAIDIADERGLCSKACHECLPKEARVMLYYISCLVHKNTHCNNEMRRSATVIQENEVTR